MSKLEDLLAHATTVVAAIRTANGFRTDIGANVTAEPLHLHEAGAPDEMACVYLDAIDQALDPAAKAAGGWAIDLVIVAKRRSDPASRQASQIALFEDIDRAMSVRSGWPAGVPAPHMQTVKFITRAEGLGWVGLAARYPTQIPRPRA